MKLALLGATLVAALAPAAAQAATPFEVGQGRFPDVAVDSAGTAYVVWDEQNDSSSVADPLRFCKVPRGSVTCAVSVTLNPPLESISRSTYVFVPADGRVVIATHRCCGAGEGTWAYQSTDGGATFDAGRQIGTLDFGAGAIFGPGEAVTGADASSVQVMPLAGPPATERADLNVGFSVPTYGSVGLFAGGALVHAASDNANLGFNRHTGGDPNADASWSPPSLLGAGDEVQLAGGPAGLAMGYVVGPGGGRQLVARKYDGTNFGEPRPISEKGDPFQPDLYADPASGTFHALWIAQSSPVDDLRWSYSEDAITWSAPQTIVRGANVQDNAFHMQVAAAADGKGWGVFDENGPGRVRVVPLEPGEITGNSATKTLEKKTVGGTQLKLLGPPGTCVARGTSLPLRMSDTAKKKRRAKVRGVVFRVNKKKKKVDRKRPFSTSFATAALRRGSRNRAAAQISLRLPNGKLVTAKLDGIVRICP